MDSVVLYAAFPPFPPSPSGLAIRCQTSLPRRFSFLHRFCATWRFSGVIKISPISSVPSLLAFVLFHNAAHPLCAPGALILCVNDPFLVLDGPISGSFVPLDSRLSSQICVYVRPVVCFPVEARRKSHCLLLLPPPLKQAFFFFPTPFPSVSVFFSKPCIKQVLLSHCLKTF